MMQLVRILWGLPRVLQNTSGFVYYVSITGITGAAEAEAGDVGPEVVY